jgi:hypothetical protein
MAEANGNEARAALEHLKARVDAHDGDIDGLRSIVKDLSHAMVVQAHLERKQSDAIVESREREDRIDARIDNLLTAGRDIDARIDKLVLAIGGLIARIPPAALR